MTEGADHETARQRCEELRCDPEFESYLRLQEQASLKAFGKPMSDETRLALAFVWNGNEE